MQGSSANWAGLFYKKADIIWEKEGENDPSPTSLQLFSLLYHSHSCDWGNACVCLFQFLLIGQCVAGGVQARGKMRSVTLPLSHSQTSRMKTEQQQQRAQMWRRWGVGLQKVERRWAEVKRKANKRASNGALMDLLPTQYSQRAKDIPNTVWTRWGPAQCSRKDKLRDAAVKHFEVTTLRRLFLPLELVARSATFWKASRKTCTATAVALGQENRFIRKTVCSSHHNWSWIITRFSNSVKVLSYNGIWMNVFDIWD